MEAILFICMFVIATIGFLAGRHDRAQTRKDLREKAYRAGLSRGTDQALMDPQTVAKAHAYHTSRR